MINFITAKKEKKKRKYGYSMWQTYNITCRSRYTNPFTHKFLRISIFITLKHDKSFKNLNFNANHNYYLNDKNYVKFNDMNHLKDSNLLQKKSFKIKIRSTTKDIKELSKREFLKWTAKESKFSVSIRDRDFERVLIIFWIHHNFYTLYSIQN